MDMNTIFLHTSEPGHLPFGELVDGVGQKSVHFFESQDAKNVLCDEFILKSVIDKVFGPYPVVQKTFDLLDHPSGQPFVKPSVNSCDPLFTADQCPDVIRVLRHESGSFHRMLTFVHRHFQSSDYPSFGLQDSFVRQWSVAAQLSDQDLRVVLFKLFP